jgi:peptidoglycan/xylan/chitin deacetylase (PgdA/CDA1 family)
MSALKFGLKSRKGPVVVPSFVKTGVSVSAHLTGLSRWIAARYRGRGIIFALHSIVDNDAVHPDYSLRCSVKQLAWTLNRLRTEMEFVSLDEAVARLAARSARPFAAFTFDDGYADNLTHALPVMQRFAAPFTVYVTTGMVTRQIDAWWFGLAELIRSQQRIELPAFKGRFDCADLASKKRAFRTIEGAIHSDFGVLSHVRAAIAEKNIDCGALADREALTKQQLRRLAQHPLVTIGGHTTTHRNLAQAPGETVEWEMAENRRFLQAATDQPIEHFAYPFGHARACGEREAEISRKVGFRTAATTRNGALFPEHAQHLHALPRIHLACDDTPSTLRCKVDGVYSAIQSRWGNPVARM